MRDPQKNFPRAVIGGVAIVIALYLLANLAYLNVLSPAEIAATDSVALLAHDARHRRVGRQAPDGRDPLLDARRDERARSSPGRAPTTRWPRTGSSSSGSRASTRAGARPSRRSSSRASGRRSSSSSSAGFSQLFTYVIFGGWIFYALAVLSVIVLRRKEPGLRAALPRAGLSRRPDPLRRDRPRDRRQHARSRRRASRCSASRSSGSGSRSTTSSAPCAAAPDGQPEKASAPRPALCRRVRVGGADSGKSRRIEGSVGQDHDLDAAVLEPALLRLVVADRVGLAAARAWIREPSTPCLSR